MLCAWYNTVEFYVIAGAVAAAVVAMSALPSRRGAAVLHLEAGELLPADGEPARPGLEVGVDRHGRVVITRHGLRGIAMDGAVSLAINVTGFDISVEERLTPGNATEMAASARFVLDWLGAERYHIKYNGEDAGVFAAFSLPVRPGIKISREFV